MTIRQFLVEESTKLGAPYEGDLGNVMKVLDTDIHGWTDATTSIDAQKVNIGGVDYTVRTGTEGAEGFITLAPNRIYIGTKPCSMQMGDKAVDSIYVGTTKVFENSGYFEVYYNAYRNGILWTSDVLPRPNYRDFAKTDYSNADVGSGYILQYIATGGGSNSYNTHAITTKPVFVPKKATKLHVYCRAESSNAVTMQFGLLPGNAPTSYSTANGGQLSTAASISGTTWQDCQMTLDASVKGREFYVVINAKGSGDASRRMRTAYVYFD